MRTEDAVRAALTARAEAAPVTTDGRRLLERVGRREAARRRLRVTAAAVAVGVLVGGAALWRSQHGGQGTTAALPRPAASAPSVAHWGDLSFTVPRGWSVNDTHETHPYPSMAMVDGPFLGTLRTGPMCFPTSDGYGCGRAHGILERRPADGVVAWITYGRVLPEMPGTQADPGPRTDGVCPPGGTSFHAFRLLHGTGGARRVAVDGCAYGPRTAQYLGQLRSVADSMRLP